MLFFCSGLEEKEKANKKEEKEGKAGMKYLKIKLNY